MIGLFFALVFSVVCSVIMVFPIFKIAFGDKKSGMIRFAGVVSFALFVFSYVVKSFFIVFITILPFLIISSIIGFYISIKHVKKAVIEKRLERTFNLLIFLFFVIYFVVAIFGRAWIGVPYSGLEGAEQTDKIEYSIDFNNMRLVPPDLANALSKTKNTFSNYHVGEKDVYYNPNEERLKWISALEPDNVLIGFSSECPGFIEGYAGGTLNPTVDFVEKNIAFSEERPLWNNVYTQVWLNDPTHEYGDALLVENGDSYVWVVPLMRNYYNIIMTYDGVATVDANTGATNIYSDDEIPEWLSSWRTYPAEVAEWRVSVYSLFKKGIINAFIFKNDIDEIPGGTEPYLINMDDQVYWFVSVEPAGGQEKRALSGYYLIGANAENAGEAIFVNKKQKNFIGPTVASNYVQSKVSNFEGWTAMQPLLYPYEGKETWVVPILYMGGEFAGMKLVGVGFVDTETQNVEILTAEEDIQINNGNEDILTGSKDELIAEYEKYKQEIDDRLEKIDEIVKKLSEVE